MAQQTLASPTIDETIASIIDDGFVSDDRADTVRYLRENPDLLPVLVRIRERLAPPLATGMPLRLRLAYDPEWEDDPPRLWVRIPTTLDVQRAMEELDVVDRSWWLDEFRPFGDRLGLDLEFV